MGFGFWGLGCGGVDLRAKDEDNVDQEREDERERADVVPPSHLCVCVLIDSGLVGCSGRGSTRAEAAQGTPTQIHMPPSIFQYTKRN